MERIRNVSHLRPYFLDEKVENLHEKFTAPRKRNKRFDAENFQEGNETINAEDLETGISTSSPYAQMLNERKEREGDSDSDDGDEKQVRFAE